MFRYGLFWGSFACGGDVTRTGEAKNVKPLPPYTVKGSGIASASYTLPHTVMSVSVSQLSLPSLPNICIVSHSVRTGRQV